MDNSIKIVVQDSNGQLPIKVNQTTIDKYFNIMFNMTFIPLIKKQTKYKLLNIIKIIPLFCCFVLFSSLFSILFYPNYYPSQDEIWTTDLGIGLIVYIYLLKLQNIKVWAKANNIEEISIPKWKNVLSLIFYSFLMLYFAYYSVIQFSVHNQKDFKIQLFNTLMSFAWYLFFSVMSAIYYFICTKLSQRAESINLFLKNLKKNKPEIEEFYRLYNFHHKKIKLFARYWNFTIFLGFLLLTFHIPIDLMSIIYQKIYLDIPGFVIKLFALGWYTYCICHLNNYEGEIIPYLYKHQIYSIDKIEEIEKYIEHRKVGLDFYGIKMNGNLIIKTGLILINLIIPTIYALLSNKIGINN